MKKRTQIARHAMPFVVLLALVGVLLGSCSFENRYGSQGSSASPSVADNTQSSELTPTEPQDEPDEEVEPHVLITPTTEFSRALADGEIDSIMVVGDSISAGRGADDYVVASDGKLLFIDPDDGTRYYEPYATNGSWANYLRRYCAAAGVDEFLNASIPGSSFKWFIQVADEWVGEGADAIVVMLGTNDAMRSQRQFIYACTYGLWILSNHCDYLLVILPPNSDRQDLSSNLDIAYADTLLAWICETYDVEYISAYEALEPGTDDYTWDQVHPTSEGSEKLWNYIAEELGFGWDEPPE